MLQLYCCSSTQMLCSIRCLLADVCACMHCRAGICCIVPPPGWSPPFALEKGTNGMSAESFRFLIRRQLTSHLCMRLPNTSRRRKAAAAGRYIPAPIKCACEFDIVLRDLFQFQGESHFFKMSFTHKACCTLAAARVRVAALCLLTHVNPALRLCICMHIC